MQVTAATQLRRWYCVPAEVVAKEKEILLPDG